MTRMQVPRSPSAPRMTREMVIASGVVQTDRPWKLENASAFPGATLAPDRAAGALGTTCFYNQGLAFLTAAKSYKSSYVGGVATRAAGQGFGLIGLLVAHLIGAAARNARTPSLQEQLADPRTLFVPLLDIVEVAHDRVGATDVLVVTADPGDGARYPFCFLALGPGACEQLFVLRFFAEKRLIEEAAQRVGMPLDPRAVLGQLAHFQHVPSLAPYFHGAPLPPQPPHVRFQDAVGGSTPAPALASALAAAPTPFCPTCGAPARWLADQGRWGCDRCRQYVEAPPRAAAPAQAPARAKSPAKWIVLGVGAIAAVAVTIMLVTRSSSGGHATCADSIRHVIAMSPDVKGVDEARMIKGCEAALRDHQITQAQLDCSMTKSTQAELGDCVKP